MLREFLSKFIDVQENCYPILFMMNDELEKRNFLLYNQNTYYKSIFAVNISANPECKENVVD